MPYTVCNVFTLINERLMPPDNVLSQNIYPAEFMFLYCFDEIRLKRWQIQYTTWHQFYHLYHRPVTWLLECLHRLIESAMQSMNNIYIWYAYDIEGENEYRRVFNMAPVWLLQYSYYTGDILRILHALYAFWCVFTSSCYTVRILIGDQPRDWPLPLSLTWLLKLTRYF